MKEGQEIFFGELEVTNNLITYIGKNRDNYAKADRIIDLEGRLIMPGFKNAHTHSPMTFLRSYADDEPLNEWLHNSIFPMENKLAKGDQYHLAKVAFAEYVSSGITACFDMYYTPLETATASVDVGFRTVLLGTVTKYKESVEEMTVYYDTINKMHPLVRYELGFHAEYTATEEILVELAKAAQKLKAPIWAHISETSLEVEGCKQRHNYMTPAQYFESLGLYKYGGGGFHGVHFTKEDIEVFKRNNLTIVTNPSANTKLASGIAPITDFLANKLNIAIGTDGPASNNALDFFREMFLVTGLAKLREQDASVVDALEVLKMATVNGAKALRLDNADILAKNKLADLIVIDLYQPNMQPINNIEKNIVYSGSKSNIYLTMIDGKILFEKGEFFLGEPIKEIYKKAQEITDRIKNS